MNCSDCPPAGYPTDETRCVPCPLRKREYHSEWCDRMNGGFECNCEAGDLSPTIEEQIAQLKAAGWIPLTPKCWKAPVDSGCAGVFLGPHGAWKAMRRRAK